MLFPSHESPVACQHIFLLFLVSIFIMEFIMIYLLVGDVSLTS